jgi:hypothetical protein
MSRIVRLQHVAQYPQKLIGWYVYDLLAYPAAVASLRRLNDHDWDESPHPTLSWKKDANLRRAIKLTCDLLTAWQAFRSRVPGLQEQLIPTIQQQLPDIILTFQEGVRRLGIGRILDVLPSDLEYPELVGLMARGVQTIANLKHVNNPMLGSKVLHFFFPEFFPVWDTEWIRNRCLPKEQIETPKSLRRKLPPGAGLEYAAYVDLMVRDLSKVTDYYAVRKACLQMAWMEDEVADWLYHDMAPTVFEICLLGKHVKK